ncbi:DUF6456 domain-containing protein [Devosia chinhatensis]|uniref:DUF6456 domain-containing protein n=1 Tax=Devosia chinhatensis TaxID=429727 RepID=UPI000A98F035|nr:DUF6456 domain-containing protein [Devosia chinhatensis]
MTESSSPNDRLPDAVLRLGAGKSEETFLRAHHLEASRRLTLLFGKAALAQRVTMSYDPARVGGRRSPTQQADLADSAAHARRLLAELARRMPRDCWDLLTDICAFDKGLQQVEQERGWPRRSAKLVLRIGLEQFAGIMGLREVAEGRPTTPSRTWLPERPPLFPEPPH